MANQQHLDILKEGVEAWNQWRQEYTDLREAGLQGTDLSNVNLFRVNFNGIDLRGTNFRGTDLREANLSGADLSGADLSGADLSGANLNRVTLISRIDPTRANLRGANLFIANLRGANLRGANLRGADLSYADLSGADLSGANLSEATLVRTNFSGATLTNCNIYGISAWHVELKGATQNNLVITPYGEPIIAIDNLEVAQFIHLLLDHKKLRDVFDAVTERGVLILGRFGSGGLEVLQAIAVKLREEHYLPIIFDFERPQDRNYTETVKTLAGLARFVIADLSGPSVPQELYATVPHFKIPFVPIIESNRKPYSMAVDIFEYPWVVRPPITFSTTEELLEQIPTKVIAPAEEKHQARQKLLDELFNTS